jgi:hypothetical protein
VAFLPFQQDRQPIGKTALERKREAIWHNPDRNAYIVDLVRAIQSNDQQWLARIPCWQTLASVNPLEEGEAYSVAVLVESPEHARELQRQMPDWNVLIAENGSTIGWPDGQPLHRVILTERAAQNLLLVDTDVLIRATGGQTPFPVREARHDQVAQEAMAILDIADEGCAQMHSDTRQRRADYVGHDWHVV